MAGSKSRASPRTQPHPLPELAQEQPGETPGSKRAVRSPKKGHSFMTTTPHYPLTTIAKRLGISRQTLTRYRDAGAPLHDFWALDEWISQHKIEREVARLIARGKP